MGAIFFYIFIYFIGYYGSNVLNMFTVRPLITNRFLAALLPVYGVALTHAYVLVSSPPPQGTDITVEYALMVYIVLPAVVVTLGAIYFMWNSKGKQEEPSGNNSIDNDSKVAGTDEVGSSYPEAESNAGKIESTDEELVNKEGSTHNKDSKEG
ncbi:MAG: hypothetical protein E6Q62_10390 [Nitrosomonas sp.]|nr:MAG: hypothetical protein E6Q62_10390 [Nitrosomonas sp.]